MKTITFLMTLLMILLFCFGGFAQDQFAKNSEENNKQRNPKQYESIMAQNQIPKSKTYHATDIQLKNNIIPEQRYKILIEQYYDIQTGNAEKEEIIEEIQLLIGYIPSDLRSIDPDQE